MDETEQASSFGVNSTSFNALRVSSYPWYLNGTRVNCTDQVDNTMNNANVATVSTTIGLIEDFKFCTCK